ncbi:hypothetical protein [Crateriforma conspicua]|uniref:hypothetical protein n=1 Tax=Crateriforma TaxID=2714592 RepID=UPI0011B432EC|nr:hypothetical protein [Crateriforma conspicua]
MSAGLFGGGMGGNPPRDFTTEAPFLSNLVIDNGFKGVLPALANSGGRIRWHNSTQRRNVRSPKTDSRSCFSGYDINIAGPQWALVIPFLFSSRHDVADDFAQSRFFAEVGFDNVVPSGRRSRRIH